MRGKQVKYSECLLIINAYKEWMPCLRLLTLIFFTKPCYFKFVFLSKESTRSSHSIKLMLKIIINVLFTKMSIFCPFIFVKCMSNISFHHLFSQKLGIHVTCTCYISCKFCKFWWNYFFKKWLYCFMNYSFKPSQKPFGNNI